MRATVIKDKQLVVEERPDPVAADGEVLVRVRAAGLNGADIMQAAGHYPPPPGVPADIPGMELAGEVVARGPRAERFEVGDRVMAIVGGGAQAELCVVHERMLMAVPDSIDWPQAGGFPEVFITAHDAVFTQAGLVAGERLLVHGAAGGVGTAAVQLGRAAGARVTATVRNPDHREQVAALGATVIAPEGFGEHGPFDVVLELVGAINLAENLMSLETGGRISIIGTGAGATAEINLGLVMMKRARIHGSTLRARPLELKALATRAVERSALPALAGGEITVPIAESFPLERVADAYDRFRAGGKLGKIVLLPAE
jgi:putative PIG3 family NAD(P)H quinone oxidoreductase